MPRDSGRLVEVEAQIAPVLAVGLGRGGSGKSTGLAELVWRARSQGRNPIIADGDPRSQTLSQAFPGEAISPATEEMPDVKEFLAKLLDTMAQERRSAVLDLGGGDRALVEYGRDLPIVEFCEELGINPVALFFMGPEEEDFRHVESLWNSRSFNPKRVVLILNEGVLRAGRTTAGAFERTIAAPGFQTMVEAGGKSLLMKRLAAMERARANGGGLYAASTGGGDKPLGPTDAFMCKSWIRDLEARREQIGIIQWLP